MRVEPKNEAPPIKVVALMEATTLTGPAKNLIEFCQLARVPHQNHPSHTIEVSIVTFNRRAKSKRIQTNGNSLEPTSSTETGKNEFANVARDAGINIDVIDERFRFDWEVMDAMRAILRVRQPHIIQTHNVKSHFLVKLLGLYRHCPWVAFHHGYTSTNLKMRAYNKLNLWSLPTADRVVTVCRSFATDLSHQGVSPNKIVVQHNSIRGPLNATDEEKILTRESLQVTGADRVILSVGRFSREKAQIDLIRAVAQMQATNPTTGLKLVLVGEGPEEENLRREVQRLGLKSHIVFAGHTRDVRPYYAISDLLVLPSHSEGSPNVLLEAMAARLPIVATNVGGIPEIVEHNKTALLVPPGNPQSMALAIYRLLSEPEMASRLATEALRVASSQYSPESYASALTGIYRQLLTERITATSKAGR